jgi:hypothetical protein
MAGLYTAGRYSERRACDGSAQQFEGGQVGVKCKRPDGDYRRLPGLWDNVFD